MESRISFTFRLSAYTKVTLKQSLLKLQKQKMLGEVEKEGCEKNNGQNTNHSLVFYFCNQYRFPASFIVGDHKVSLSLKIQETQIETEICASLITW